VVRLVTSDECKQVVSAESEAVVTAFVESDQVSDLLGGPA
jgi:hypothetical protein